MLEHLKRTPVAVMCVRANTSQVPVRLHAFALHVVGSTLMRSPCWCTVVTQDSSVPEGNRLGHIFGLSIQPRTLEVAILDSRSASPSTLAHQEGVQTAVALLRNQLLKAVGSNLPELPEGYPGIVKPGLVLQQVDLSGQTVSLVAPTGLVQSELDVQHEERELRVTTSWFEHALIGQQWLGFRGRVDVLGQTASVTVCLGWLRVSCPALGRDLVRIAIGTMKKVDRGVRMTSHLVDGRTAQKNFTEYRDDIVTPELLAWCRDHDPNYFTPQSKKND